MGNAECEKAKERKILEELEINEEIIKITSVHQFIKVVQELVKENFDDKSNVENGKEAENASFFYRGESTLFETSLPSIFRDEGLFENEKKITIEAISGGTKELKGENTNFNIISKIQHHKGITRMLDVTTNALTALFFACSSTKEDGNMGSVQIYTSTDRKTDGETKFDLRVLPAKTKTFSSDTAEILSTLAFLTTNEKKELAREAKKAKEVKEEANDKSSLNKCSSLTSPAAKQLLGEVKRRIPAFEDRIDPIDLFLPLFVIPSQNDERITRQDGAFLVIGLGINGESDSKKDEPSYFDSEASYAQKLFTNLRLKKEKKPVRFLIETEEEKIELRKQLADLGIHAGKIYADLDHISEYLKSKYSKITSEAVKDINQ